MRLFFETSVQAEAFLFTVPLGMLLAAGFDLTAAAKRCRVLLDVLLFLLCAIALLYWIRLMRDEGLRMYHLLALCVGMLLYVRGVGALARAVIRRLRSRSSRDQTKSN